MVESTTEASYIPYASCCHGWYNLIMGRCQDITQGMWAPQLCTQAKGALHGNFGNVDKFVP